MINNMDSFKYKIGIYVRESRDDNEENYETIETQRDLLLNYVRINNLGDVVNIYMDDNVSGSGFERLGIDMLSKDVHDGIINLLIIKDLSRLGRNNAKTLLFLDFLEEYSVRVITFDGKYDSARDNDTVGIQTWFNEHYIKDISKKIRSNLRFKIEKGEYIGNAPFGYKKKSDEKNRLEVDSSCEDIIRFIFKLYLEGFGYQHIANTLNSNGYPTPSMKINKKEPSPFWNAVSVKRILFNRVYIGDTVQGISEKISFKSKKTRRLPSEKWVLTKGTHTAIISNEDFEAADKIRNTKVHLNKQHKGYIHLFKDVIYCGNCGKLMYARRRKDKPMGYICSTYFKSGRNSCSSHFINEDFICEIVKNEIKKTLLSEKNDWYNDTILNKKHESENLTLKNIEKLEKAITSKEKQQEILYQDRLEGRISEQLFDRYNQNMEKRISELRIELNKIRNYTFKSEISNEILDIENLNLTNCLLKYFIEKIIVTDKGDKQKLYTGNIEKENIADEDCVIICFNI